MYALDHQQPNQALVSLQQPSHSHSRVFLFTSESNSLLKPNEQSSHEQDAYTKLIRDENESTDFNYHHEDGPHMTALQSQNEMQYHMNLQDVSSFSVLNRPK